VRWRGGSAGAVILCQETPQFDVVRILAGQVRRQGIGPGVKALKFDLFGRGKIGLQQ
jgi:hypothetical protein